ncbi:tetratricopeptide repeat protein [Nocardia sp. NPDC057353]|uniref:tetratricopeptide repeat protein n=1 Tax=Nocardia sp. NPDC057353 TaxID=3346104 RepID=UPI00363BCBC6
MSTEPADSSSDTDLAARRGGEQRSTLWRVAVGTTPVVATALTLEFGRTLVVDSFGESEVVETLASTLRAFWILLVVGGVLFAGYRWYSQRRDGERLERTRALLDALDKPQVPVDGIASEADSSLQPVDSPRNRTEMAVLQHLPARRYDSALLLAVAAALTDAAHSLRESDSSAPTYRSPTDLVEQLLRDRILAVAGAYYSPTVWEPVSAHAEVLTKPAWATALYTLVHEHAERARARAAALEHPEYAMTARAWFDSVQGDLRGLITGCHHVASHKKLPKAVLPELIRIIDALDVYYGYDHRSADLRALVTALSTPSEFPLHRALLQLRANPAGAPKVRLRPLAWSNAVAARRRHGHTLERFDTAEDGPDATARKLEQVWRRLPRADLHAEVCVLVNLAVVELRRGNLDAAGDRLDLAFARTENGRDPGGRAHATEILGILHWMRGEQIAALLAWRTAYTGYRALADDRGRGRCLRHLGSALRAAPEFGGSAVAPPAPDQPLNHDRVVRQARGWLTAADLLDPASPAAPPPPSAMPGLPMDSSPLELPDPHLRIPRPTADS